MEPQTTGTNKIIITVIILAVAVIGIYALINSGKEKAVTPDGSVMVKDGGAMMDKKSDAMMNESMKMRLASVGNSGVTGDVLFTPKGDKTEVSIMLKGAAQGSVYPSHIHFGGCPAGAVKYPFMPIVDGKSVSLINVSIEQLWKELPLSVNVHKSASELKTIVACGDLKTATGDPMGDSMVKAGGTMMQKEEGTMMVKAGSYEAYSPEKIATKSAMGDVVLFFRASWCPVCRALNTDIITHLKDIPANLTILVVDYDNSSDLKNKYGVVLQSTMVQVDKNGELIKKWNMMNSTPTLATFLAELKQ